MAPPKRESPLQSPLVSAFNNIVNINRSKSQMRSTQRSYNDFLRFMDVEVKNIESIKLPDEKKVKRLANINVASTFGSAGGLLSSLASGALDAAGLVGNLFGGRGRNPNVGKAVPKSKGLKLGGVKALGVVNAVFAGMDFVEGLQQGESVSKAAAGAGGNLAGSLIGGAIGQALVPIPGLGFVIGSAAGGMLGGYLGDRAHEAVTGEGTVKEKTKARLKQQEQKQKTEAAALTQLTFPQVLDKFDSVVVSFERAVAGGLLGASDAEQLGLGGGKGDLGHEQIDPRTGGGPEPENPQDVDYTSTGGSLPSKYINTKDYNEFRQYYNGGKGGRHQGEDLPIGQGTKVSIIVPGKVAQAGFDGGGAGGNILITHEDGKQTRYLHMSEIYVKPGDTIQAGQVIGATGGTPGTKGAGRSTGAHLHFEFYNSTGGGPSDPIPQMDRYFRFGGNVKVTPKPGAGTSSSSGVKPTIVLAGGTNDYGSPATAKANMMRSIKELQSKGYNVIVVPPSEQGAFANVSKAVQEAASESGATIEKGQYNPKDRTKAYAHLTEGEQDRIRKKYKGATFIGDSNASGLSGGDVSGRIKTGASTAEILQFTQSMGRVSSTVQPRAMSQVAPAQTQSPAQQIQQIQQYPDYNLPQSTVTIVPMMMGGGGSTGAQQRPMVISSGGGGGTTIMPPVPQGQVLNSLFKTILLTNLSGS